MTITETLLRRGREQGVKVGHAQGVKKCREETQRENLIKLLRLRFGPLPESVLDRIDHADLAQMNHWFERGVTAKTLAAVFSDSL